MTPQQVETHLRSYKESLARLSHLEVYIAELKESEAIKVKDYRDDMLQGLGSQNLDGQPHGTSVSSPTERAGIALASGYCGEEVAILRMNIAHYEAEASDKRKTVLFVQAWMKGLTEKEQKIIEWSFFDEMTYRQMISRHIEVYGDVLGKDSLRRIKNEALAKICKFAE